MLPVDLSMDFFSEESGSHGLRYAASKILAHQATRDFLKDNAPHYTTITIHPTFVLGHSLIQSTAEELGGINVMFWQSLMSEQPTIGNAWVDVHDVADAHVKCLETEIANGTEIILSAPPVSWESVANFVKDKYPMLGCKLQPPFDVNWTLDTTTANQVLGMKWRSWQSIVEDVVNQQLSLRK